MKQIHVLLGATLLFGLFSFKADESKLITKTGHISIFSHTVAEDITANNYKVTSSFNPSTGEMVFAVPMQGFEFEKALMQKHFNSPKFLDTKQYPKAKFKGAITNMEKINIKQEGVYPVTVEGDLDLHGVTNHVVEKGEIHVKAGHITATSKFRVELADYKIAFEKGKPSTNIAKEIEITLNMKYQ
ncbi:MAG: YceI family protein [Flavobacteriales bacterium]|nr:YceI family protein [Flavobacteriales bacterium]